MVGITDGMDIAHQTDEGLGEIGVVGDGPQGGTVAVDDDGLAVYHALQHLPGALVTVSAHGHIALVVGVAGADDRHREAVLPMHLHQVLFAGDLVAAVLPVGIHQRRGLGDLVIPQGLLVGRGGGDEHELLGLTSKEAIIPLQLGGYEGDEVAHAVEGEPFDGLGGFRLIVDVGVDGMHACGQFSFTAAAVEQVQLPVGMFRQGAGDGHGDGAGTANKERFHGKETSLILL